MIKLELTEWEKAILADALYGYDISSYDGVKQLRQIEILGGREMEKIVQAMIDLQIGLLNNIGVRAEQYIQCVKELDKIKKILGIKQSYYMERLNKELLGDKEWNE